ncbi:nuclear factor interleukin-3-regulated protein isoform X2 [Cimex lectularius]|nr:nuclear factor interleukin-3-regulated protein isoform X2 [Cimex lectularius]XP_014249423.1 nuclear factor interleukin-3-regulated protein isoform X2 [Cimex lectularius]XP_024082021.1 nuclear factor interleukin-3-regulated protein isoform X2 [Cimex lectularius]
MMVGEFIERPNNSPVNGETLHQPAAPINNNNSTNGNNNIPTNGNMTGGSTYCFIEPNVDLNLMGREGDTNSSPEASNTLPDNYTSTFELNNHLQRKDLFSQRKQREFIPDNKKDESYWDRRRRNNEAAKRSREKRRYNDMILEQRVVELSKENHFLKAQLSAIKDKYGISGETIVNVEQVMATLPTNDQVLSMTKRAKIANAPLTPPILYQPSSHPTPVIHRTVSNSSSPPLAPLNQAYPDSESYNDVDRYPFPHFPPVLPPLNPPALEAGGNSVLNLSRSGRRTSPTPYDLPPVDLPTSSNNSLPHKLRHKSHLGDKDVAATALLSLHNIKQEPNSRASPPWDGEGSSDERDSGISLGAEWIISTHNVPDGHPTPSSPLPHNPIENEDEDSHLKSEVARLASEVASLKSMLSRNKNNPLGIN